jgi:L-histidine Nalpha-methyltransferase
MSTAAAPNVRASGLHPPAGPDPALYREVLAGLRAARKRLPCKYFYDETGSALFDRICDLPEYYLTRTEMAIMRDHAGDIARRIGPGCQLVELGSGSSIKTRLLLDALPEVAAYVPVDISGEHLRRAAARLAAAYPNVEVLPVCADYTQEFEIPAPSSAARADGRDCRRVAYFPGSTVGNFDPDEARQFLQRLAALVGSGGGLLIGFDLKKDPALIHAAYNDAAGVTAAFNLNLLARLNRELGADFDVGQFRHYAFYQPAAGRIEMHLVSERPQSVRVNGDHISIARGESIHTECSYKYTPAEFDRLARAAGFEPAGRWTDPREWFCVEYLVAR